MILGPSAIIYGSLQFLGTDDLGPGKPWELTSPGSETGPGSETEERYGALFCCGPGNGGSVYH